MSTLKLNVYRNQKDIEKTLETESYDLMFGTVEEVLKIFDADSLTDNKAIAATIVKCFGQIKPLLFDIFPDATEEDLTKIKIKELVPLFLALCGNIANDIGLLSQGNLTRA